MGQTYTRQSSFSNGDDIDAELFNAEFDQLQETYDKDDGHAHDGTTGAGGLVPFIKKGDSSVAINVDDPSNNKIVFILDGTIIREFSEEGGDSLADTVNISHTPDGEPETDLKTYLDSLASRIPDAEQAAQDAEEAAQLAVNAAQTLGVPIVLDDGATYTIPASNVQADIICLGNAVVNLPNPLNVGHRVSIRVSSKANTSATVDVRKGSNSHVILGDRLTVSGSDTIGLKRTETMVLDVISSTELEII